MLARNPDKPVQLLFSFPQRPALGREDFLLGPSNRAAFAAIDAWPDWSAPVQLIVGPAGSGKSHLVEIWAQAAGAYIARDRFLVSDVLRAMDEGRPVAIEFGEARAIDERAVFHVLNSAGQMRSNLLLTARRDLPQWNIGLPDLVSRLRAVSPIVLGLPDDELLKQVMVKLIADRQTQIATPILDQALIRLERSFEAANLFVTYCDEIALRSATKISRTVAAEALLAVQGRMAEI